MQQIKGKIKGINQKENNYSVILENDPRWFSAFGTCEFQKGQEVVIDYVFNDPWYNIKSINLVEQVKPEDKANQFEQPVEVVKVGEKPKQEFTTGPNYYEAQDKRQQSIENQFSVREGLKMLEIHNASCKEEDKIKPNMSNIFNNAVIIKSVLDSLAENKD